MKKTASLILALIIALTALLSGCGEKAETVGEFTLAATPEPGVQAQIDKTLASFIKCYDENNAAGALELFTGSFEATEEDVAAFFANVKKLTANPFVPYDAYYMKGLTESDVLIKVKKAESDANYIELAPASGELYCALYASESEKISYMMTLLLTKEGEEFKIAFINPGDFKYNGEDAPALFEKTRALYNDNKLISAYITSCMLGNTLRPGGYFRYADDVVMEDMCYKLFTEISEKFELPLALEGTSNSAIYEIGIANDDAHGIIPLFLFKTDVKTDDTAALTAEAQKVIDAVEKLSPGIRESFDYARFNATNDDLNENTTSVASETVTLKLK